MRALSTRFIGTMLAALLMLPGYAPAQDTAPTLDEALSAITTYEFGQSRQMLSAVADHVWAATGKPADAAAVAAKLAAVLTSDATDDCKQFICRQLALIGTSDSVPALASLLGDERLSHMARYALERIDSPATDRALRGALRDVEGTLRIGVINSVGRRGDAQAIPQLAELVGEADHATSAAAAEALGLIGGPRASRVLLGLLDDPSLDDQTADAAINALLVCAEQMADDGKAPLADPIFNRLYEADEPEHVRMAALRGLCTTRGREAVPLVLDELGADSNRMRGLARTLIATMDGEGVTAGFAERVAALPAERQVTLLTALGDRGDRAALPALTAAAKNRDDRVSAAAFAAIPHVAELADLPDVVELLLSAGAPRREPAAQALVDTCLRIEDADARSAPIIQALQSADGAGKALLLGSLSRVGGSAALAATREALDEADTRDAAVRALADWPDTSAAEDLVRIVQTSDVDEHAQLAFAGYVRLAALTAPANPTEALVMYAKALGMAPSDAHRLLVFAGLGAMRTSDALSMALEYVEDDALTEAAGHAAVSIARAIAPEDRDQAESAIHAVLAATDDAAVRTAAGAALNDIQINDGYIQQWLVSGPYTQEGVNGTGIFDVAFAPETDPEHAEWRPLPDDARSFPGRFDLLKIGSGDDRCAYVRVEIESDVQRSALLELGSDDGLKVWLNGKAVHANNAMRGLTLRSDAVKVDLQEGANTLMLKVTQGGGDWAFACRIRTADGFALEGVEFEPR